MCSGVYVFGYHLSQEPVEHKWLCFKKLERSSTVFNVKKLNSCFTKPSSEVLVLHSTSRAL